MPRVCFFQVYEKLRYGNFSKKHWRFLGTFGGSPHSSPRGRLGFAEGKAKRTSVFVRIRAFEGAGRRSVGRSVAQPDGEGRRRSRAPLGGTRAAVDDGAGVADAEARDDEAVAPSAATLSHDMATSTHVGEVRCAAWCVTNAGPSACCAGLVKSECPGCVWARGAP